MSYAMLEGLIVALIVLAAVAYAVWRWRPGKKNSAGCGSGCGSCSTGCGPKAAPTPPPNTHEHPVHFHR
ncbi:MAG: FeoB-associated Cys-rich membrane protein [Polycyclovorans sp.]|jgi:hypothetical protein|nr:FeoB-associated Cys-rich membrane protein [Polycyclovorans sp.]MEC8848920.1 FeoB-associated Cys-rich membrane protein [Pseudomonadota bacterium]|tara:strand:- start:5477 stop:5683 length:207 start_codon:yes stop_codon:yes gene_type:complete